MNSFRLSFALQLILSLTTCALPAEEYPQPTLGDHRVVLQTKWGDIELGFYENIAPKTSQHIIKLVRLGAYDSNSFFRLEAGFVTQIEEVDSGRQAPMHALQSEEAARTVPWESDKTNTLKHELGSLSMVHPTNDLNGGTSSFCIMLGDAPHLDGKYSVFGRVTNGWGTLKKIEKEVPSSNEGNSEFYYPAERITIVSSFLYRVSDITPPNDVFNANDHSTAFGDIPSWLIVLTGLGLVLLVLSRVLRNADQNCSSTSGKDQDV